MGHTYLQNAYAESEIKNTACCVTLLCYDGEMHSMWLPPHMQGRYKFSENSKNSDIMSFYAEAKNGQWVLHCSKGNEFYSIGRFGNKEYAGASIIVGDHVFYKIDIDSREYTVYVEFETESSNIFIPYYCKMHGSISIGRLPNNDICYPNSLVSRNHAVIRWNMDHWEIEDTGSLNGVYVNRKKVRKSELQLGDLIWIMGLQIIIGVGFISINNADNRVAVNSPCIRKINNNSELTFTYKPANASDNEMFKRQPRKRGVIDTSPIEIEMPPMSLAGNSIPLLLRMGSPLVMGSTAAMSGNIAMTLTSLIFPLLTNGYSEKEKKDYEKKRVESYTEYLQLKEKEIHNVKLSQESVLRRNYPAFSELLMDVNDKKRLWERRRFDDDFLSIRLGSGQLPLLSKIGYPLEKIKLNRDPLEEKMYEIAKKEVLLDEVPIMFSLIDSYVSGIEGSIEDKIRFVQMLISQIAICHSFEEVKIVVLAGEEHQRYFDFARYLPHCWNDDRSIRFIGESKADAYIIGEYIKNEVEEDIEKYRKLNEILKHRPYYVVFALDKSLYDSIELLKEIVRMEESCGLSIITAFDNVPIECHRMIELYGNSGGSVVDLLKPENKDVHFYFDPFSIDLLQRQMKKLSGLKLCFAENAYTLPKTYSFLEMFNVGKVEHLNPLKRWEENDPTKSLSTPVGIGTDGKLFCLDLHEKHQGPHGLVAGMTGSGKSEFIITYILSMAVNYSPDEVAFVLIDYKGGGLATSFEDERRGIHLPHLVGTITNLDGSAIQRSLMSIKSELKRRQAVFNEAKSKLNEGTMDIYTYQQHYRKKNVSEPLPHLFIISDEFAELKQQQPEFMNELISTARIGRSLGVHLILATQKPAGVVNDQIVSNTKFRVCLKVQSKQDSMDMLKRHEAAELKDIGRFYLQVGYNEYFALGQSAWCGAEYVPQDEVVAEVDNSVKFVDNTGQQVLQVKPKRQKKKDGQKQLVAIVQYLSELAKRENISSRKLWVDPLVERYELDTLLDKHYSRRMNITAMVGMVDDPERQRQYPFEIDIQGARNMLLVGNSGSGKSTLLRTMLYSLVKYYTPEELNYFIMDFSGETLGIYRSMPHCGAYLTDSDEGAIDRLFTLLKDMTEERKKMFAEAGVSSYDAYRVNHDLPLVLVIIDNFAGITALKKGNQYFTSFHEYMRDSSSYGIKFIISCNHLNDTSLRTKQEIGYRLTLQMKDRYVYGDALGCRCSIVPAPVTGRGLCAIDGQPYEYQVAVPFSESADDERTLLLGNALKQLAKRYDGCRPAKGLVVISDKEDYASFCRDIPLGRIPLGYDYKTVKKISMPLNQLYCTSVYFGNPAGVVPVLSNFMHAANREHMDLIVVKRNQNSVFDDMSFGDYGQSVEIMSNTKEDSFALYKRLIDEVGQRKRYRNAYCDQHGIPMPQRKSAGVMKKASGYIRQHTKPLFILFEDFFEFSQNLQDECLSTYHMVFESGKGYNFYFMACYYPEHRDKAAKDLLTSKFNTDDFMLLFGGQYQHQYMTNLPTEYKKFTEPLGNYNEFLMKYEGKYHGLKMPCGDISVYYDDPDDAPII